MGNFAENLNLGNRFRPPLHYQKTKTEPSINGLITSYRMRLHAEA